MFTIKIREAVNSLGNRTGGNEWYIFDCGFPADASNEWPVEGGTADSLKEAVANSSAALLKLFA
jgi:hypothetical protein